MRAVLLKGSLCLPGWRVGKVEDNNITYSSWGKNDLRRMPLCSRRFSMSSIFVLRSSMATSSASVLVAVHGQYQRKTRQRTLNQLLYASHLRVRRLSSPDSHQWILRGFLLQLLPPLFTQPLAFSSLTLLLLVGVAALVKQSLIAVHKDPHGVHNEGRNAFVPVCLGGRVEMWKHDWHDGGYLRCHQVNNVFVMPKVQRPFSDLQNNISNTVIRCFV